MTQEIPPLPIGYGQGSDQPRRPTNGAAIASLIFGVLGCIPVISGILAIILGIVGIRRARDTASGGGLAVAGLVLGIISLLGWTVFGGMIGYGYSESKPAAVVAKQFLKDVSSGNVNAALANSTGMTAAQLQTYNGQLVPFGALQGVSISGFNMSTKGMHLDGIATFANGPKVCTFDLVKIGGVYKVQASWVQ